MDPTRSPRSSPSDAERPALLFWNGIGDHLLTLPALRALAALFPGRLTLLCLRGARAAFFSDVPLGRVCELHFPSGRPADQLFDVDAAAEAVGGCDLLMCLNRSSSAATVRLLDRLSPRSSIGFFPEFRARLPFRNDQHAADQAFDLPRALDPALRLADFAGPPALPEESRARARAFRGAMPEGCRLLVIHADTQPAKIWPAARFVELLDALLERHPELIVLVVGARDLGLKAGRFAERIISCHGLPLTTSFALVAEADAFLGVDSCMLHAADLFRVPGVGLFGPGGELEFGFRFGPHRHVIARGSMETIAVGEVLEALESQLDPGAGGRRAAEPLDALRRVREALLEGIDLRRRLCDEEAPRIAAAAAVIAGSLRQGGKLLLCGNGGSAADCQHIAAELTGRFADPDRPALAAISLATDTSALTAIANDFGYEQVFARQVEALGRPGDVLLVVSTSGRSPSVLRAASRARALGMRVIALTGPAEAPLHAVAELSIRAPGRTADRIQELHISVGHVLCDLVERTLWPPGGPAEGAAR